MESKQSIQLKWVDFNLTIVLLILFLISLVGHFVFGFKTYNEELMQNGLSPLAVWTDYFGTGHFISSLSENMESEFLQMAIFVFLTMCLFQRGSAESNKPFDEMTLEDVKEKNEEEAYCALRRKSKPVRWFLYENSLTLALTTLFIISFLMHAWGSFKLINHEHALKHLPAISFGEIFAESEFWFESFQNWQSEFFSIAVIVVFSIFLRQKDSSQSKKMNAPNWKTGGA